MVYEDADDALSGTFVTLSSDELLDEVMLESFPASDPPASWSGLTSPDLIEKPDGQTGDQAV